MIQINMDKPARCIECPLYVDYDCIVLKRVEHEYFDDLYEQYRHCPLHDGTVKGRWIDGPVPHVSLCESRRAMICSICGSRYLHYDQTDGYVDYKPRFCPNCGADLRDN